LVDQINLATVAKSQERRNEVAWTQSASCEAGQTPRVMIADKLGSYVAAKRKIMPGVEHRHHKGLNNRAGNSHQPTRRRERIMKRFKSA
jgi:putative transposase